MKLEFSAPIEDITLANPVINSTDRVAGSAVTDAEGKPFIIKIHTPVSECVHNAKNRAWVDIALTDEECIKVFRKMDEHVLKSVYDRHHTAEWFNKKAPRDIIEEYCKSFIESQKSKPDPFLRLKTAYSKGEPLLELHTSTQKNPDSATITTLNTLDTLQNRDVIYEVHVGCIRFCPTTFNPELKLVAIHSYVNKEDYNLFEMVLDNATHRDQKAKILEKQQKMEEYTEKLQQLEVLKEEVEREVLDIMAKRDDVDKQYQEAMEEIHKMQTEDGENDTVEDGVTDDVVDGDGLETTDKEHVHVLSENASQDAQSNTTNDETVTEEQQPSTENIVEATT